MRCSNDSNSNIRRHLFLIHGKLELAYKSHVSQRVPIPPEKKRQLDDAAINCIIVDSRSWGDFRRKGMQKFLQIATPGYFGPSSRTVQRRLCQLYLKKKAEFKEKLSSVQYASLTADLWRSKKNRHYLCITVHFIDDLHVSKSHVLSFRKFHGRHTGQKIYSYLLKVIDEFGLKEKISSITTDNGSNIRLATTKKSIFGRRFYCVAHALNRTIHVGLRLWAKTRKPISTDQNDGNE